MDMKIDLDSSQKALVPCRHCGSVWGVVKDGKGPHAKRIDCHGCGRFLNWMGMNTAIELGLFVPCAPGEDFVTNTLDVSNGRG